MRFFCRPRRLRSPTAAARIEERLARWLLMADDRIDGKELPLTHEFLAIILGTHRPGVTRALSALEREGHIATRRRGITILDRRALETRSNGTYASAELINGFS